MKQSFLRAVVSALAVCALSTPAAHAALRVLACEPEWAALIKELGGEQVQVSSATTALQDAHHIQARPSLIARARNADLLVCTGADLEAGWLPLLQRESGNAAIQVGRPGYFAAAEQIDLLERPRRVDRADGDVHPAGNPHLIGSPRQLLAVAAALAQRLAQVDPAHASHYSARLQDFRQRLTAAIARWEQRGAVLRGVRVVVHHKNWVYLADWLGLQVVGDLEPKPGIDPSAAYLAQLRRQLDDRPARMILRAAYQSAKPAQWLSQQTGLPVLVLPYTVGGTAAAVDLFALYEETLRQLLEAVR